MHVLSTQVSLIYDMCFVHKLNNHASPLLHFFQIIPKCKKTWICSHGTSKTLSHNQYHIYSMDNKSTRVGNTSPYTYIFVNTYMHHCHRSCYQMFSGHLQNGQSSLDKTVMLTKKSGVPILSELEQRPNTN